jgi:hypothetical protein
MRNNAEKHALVDIVIIRSRYTTCSILKHIGHLKRSHDTFRGNE